MKKALLSIALIAIGTSLFAQQRNFLQTSPERKTQFDKIQKLIRTNQQNTKNKPTAIQQRVIAQSFAEEGSPISDSNNYIYLGVERGSDYNYYNLDFMYNNSLEIDFWPTTDQAVPNNLALADTIKRFSGPNNTLSEFYVGHYRADNQLDSIIYGSLDLGGTMNYEKTTNTFNFGNLIETSERMFNANSSLKTEFTYNNSLTKILSDSIFSTGGGTTSLNMVTDYKYNGNGQLDSVFSYNFYSGVQELNDLITLTYYANGDLESAVVYYLDNGNLNIDRTDTFTYNPNFASYETWKSATYDNNVMIESVNATFTLGDNGYPDSIKATLYDYSDNSSEDVIVTYEYNSANSPIKIKQYFDGVLSYNVSFYYEEYDDGETGIAKIKNQAFEIYPNPVANHIIIQNNELNTNSKWSISLIDVLGRQVFVKEQSLNAGQNVIQLPELPTGMYILNLENAKEGKASRKIMKK